jgi:hypothetical protein
MNVQLFEFRSHIVPAVFLIIRLTVKITATSSRKSCCLLFTRLYDVTTANTALQVIYFFFISIIFILLLQCHGVSFLSRSRNA